ncbi:LCCL domain-containing protein [Plasmodium gonderi]|uniref:LCCL domain-containing protein n=1 Tax=Plasmodium gonderi TaxID=77519 RepID=A0A1Y1JBN5_PLAGO|nr:LCCL domain-containing protein [Plasmodium gonderi]GAW79088.1 LCCL domain-containing protein [Plasmodium gonderi]
MKKKATYLTLICFILKNLLVFSKDATRTSLEGITEFRQQHRKTLDGRLCAAAFLHDDQTYTNCTNATSPDGTTGREWCYVEVQLLGKGSRDWDYCTNGINYDKLRLHAKRVFEEKSLEADRLKDRLYVLNSRVQSMLQKFDSVCGKRHEVVNSRIEKINQWLHKSAESVKKIEINSTDLDATKNIIDKVQVEIKRESDGFKEADENCENLDGYENEPHSDGLKVSYYNNSLFEGFPIQTRFEKEINFTYNNKGPSENISPYRYSMRYEGYIMIPHNGTYTFTTKTNCYFRLFINNKAILIHGLVQSNEKEDATDEHSHVVEQTNNESSSFNLSRKMAITYADLNDESNYVVKMSKPIELVGGDKYKFVLEVSHSSHLKFESGESSLSGNAASSASFQLFWKSSRIEKQPIQSNYLFRDNVIPPVRFSRLDADLFDIGIVNTNEQIFKNDKNWVFTNVPNRYIGLHVLKTDSNPLFDHFSASINTGSNLYIATPAKEMFPLNPSKDSNMWKAYDTDDKIEVTHNLTKEKKLYKLKFIPLKNKMVLKFNVLVGIPFMIFSENRKILPTVCNGDEGILSNPQNQVFKECTESSSISSEFNCIAGLSTYHRDKKYNIWKTSNGTIGEYIEIFFKKPVYINKFKFKPGDDILTWPSEILLRFDDEEEEVVIPILHTSNMEQNTTRLESPVITTSVKIEIRDMYENEKKSTGGSFELIGNSCNLLDEDYINHHASIEITQCNSTLSNVPDVMPLLKGDKFLASCDYHCLDNVNAEMVYGSDFYSIDSAICKASVHAGVCNIKMKQNCKFLILINDGKENYVGNLQNNIMSLSKSSTSNFSFSLSSEFIKQNNINTSYTESTPNSYSIVFKRNDDTYFPNKFLVDSGKVFTNYGNFAYGWKNPISFLSPVISPQSFPNDKNTFSSNGIYSGGIDFPPASASQNCITELDCQTNFWKFQTHENGVYSVQVLVGNKSSSSKQKVFIEVNGIPFIKNVGLDKDELFVATNDIHVTNRSIVFTSTCLGNDNDCSHSKVTIMAVQILKI